MFYKKRLVFFTLLIWSIGCKKAVEVDSPSTNLVSASVYSNNATAASAVTGIFEKMMENTNFFGSGSVGTQNMSAIAGVYADELNVYGTSKPYLVQAYKNSLTSQTNPFPFWSVLYNTIYNANAAILGLSNSTSVTSSLKDQLLGASKFARAFCYFYLVNVFGNVPLATTTNYQVNSILARTSTDSIYKQIISDLKDAQNLLDDNYLSPSGQITTERTLPNKSAATALLARVYLYIGDWIDAEAQSTVVINNTNYSLLPNSQMNSVFKANSKEAIWQLQPVQPGYNTADGYTYVYVLQSGPNASSWPLYLSSQLLSAFESGDNRLTNWVASKTVGTTTYSIPYKYKVGLYGSALTEYLMVLRLAEQYLIRAEARAQQNNIPGAQTDLNIIRTRAKLGSTSANSQSTLLSAILHERQVELFTEWGQRWLDLKRTGSANSVMSVVTPAKGGLWSSDGHQLYFPIPLSDIATDVNLVQNPGY
jgi:hypothetical protein